MKHFAVYDVATGALRRHGSCMAVDFALQAGEGEAVRETDGAARPVPSATDAVRSPAKPSSDVSP
jgi:hypothetical protein